MRQHTSAYVSRHTAYVSMRQHTSAYVSIRQHASAYVSMRQHTSAHVRIRQHASAYVSMRQHASAYVSIRQHTSAYVSIRQHTSGRRRGCLRQTDKRQTQRQYLYFCTSKASKLSTCMRGGGGGAFGRPIRGGRRGQRLPMHTSAYVSIRQHTPAYVSIRQHKSAYASIRQRRGSAVREKERRHTSAYVSIRQHTSAYVSGGGMRCERKSVTFASQYLYLCSSQASVFVLVYW
jgi:hypothetical protein